MPIWLEIFVVWLIIGVALNFLAFKTHYLKFITKITDCTYYEDGYRDAVQYLYNFYKEVGELPDEAWITAAVTYKLDVKDKQIVSVRADWPSYSGLERQNDLKA